MNRLVMAAAVLGLVGFVCPVRAEEKKADPVGTWEWEVNAGGNTRKMSIKVSKDGDKLKVVVPGRNNAETAADDVKYDSKTGELSFSVTRERNGNKITQNYVGTIKGDTLEGKIKGKNQNGEDTSRDWKATKAKSDK